MKTILLLTLCLCLFACGNNQKSQTKKLPTQKDGVEVLYFHGKRRCITCSAIEKNAKEAVEKQFADELKKGTLTFKSIDITLPENKDLIERYKVSWSSLFITKWQDGKDTTENLTLYAFSKALSAPDTLQKKITRKIRALLK